MRFTRVEAKFFNTTYNQWNLIRYCIECQKTIPKGILAARISGIWDGKFQHFHLCYSCAQTFLELSDKAEKLGNEGPAIQELQDYISNQEE